MSELPHTPVPQSNVVDQRAIEEIVSPVQPHSLKYWTFAKVSGFIVGLAVVFGLAYFVYANWPLLGLGLKVAQAPQAVIVTIADVEPTATPLAEAPSSQNSAVPRVSSITTTVPNTPAPTQPPASIQKVAGQSISKPSRIYSNVLGYRVILPANVTVAEGKSADSVVAFYGSTGKLLAKAQVVNFLLDDTAALGAQLELSPSISDLRFVYVGNDGGYAYTQEGAPALVLVRGSWAYYFVDYSGSLLDSFGLY